MEDKNFIWLKQRASGAKDAIENFNDDAEERAIAWAYEEIVKLRAELSDAQRWLFGGQD